MRQEAEKDDSTGKYCVKVRTTLRDSAPQVVTKKPDPMIIDSLYWVCKHPAGGKAVIIEYSDRFYDGDEEKDFEKNAETLFHGLKLITYSNSSASDAADYNCPIPSRAQLSKNGALILQNGVTLKCQVNNYTNKMSCLKITDSTGADGLVCSNGEKKIMFLFDENNILKGSRIF